MIRIGKLSSLDEFYSWQGKDINPPPKTVNYEMFHSSNGRHFSRYTWPTVEKDGSVSFVIDRKLPIGQYRKLLNLMKVDCIQGE